MNKSLIAATTSCVLVMPWCASADVSSTVSVNSDYSFNGVSQTSEKPALQASIDYAAENGFYAGTWASNVDFGASDDTHIEWDAYVGKYYQLNEQMSVDVGIAYYTYHGDTLSDTYNYPEAYAKFGYSSSLGNTEANFWYSWDYFGLAVDHYIAMLAHTVELVEGHSIRMSVDRSTSANKAKWAWDNNTSFNHIRLAYMTSWEGLNIDLAIEDTNMNIDNADTRIVLSVSHTFDW